LREGRGKPERRVTETFSEEAWPGVGGAERNEAADRIDSTPMKRLGYNTPDEVFPEAEGVALAS
jgi:hypothetical protein